MENLEKNNGAPKDATFKATFVGLERKVISYKDIGIDVSQGPNYESTIICFVKKIEDETIEKSQTEEDFNKKYFTFYLF